MIVQSRHPADLRLTGAVTPRALPLGPDDEALLAHLRRLDPAGVAALLELRPDVLWRPEPRDLRDLAERLSEPDGIAGVLSDLPVPSAQLCEALSALGGRTSLTELAALLGVPEDDHGLVVTLGVLQDRAVTWLDDDGGGPSPRVTADPGVLEVFPAPLGLHQPLARLLEGRTVAHVHAQLKALGEPLPASKSRAAAAEALGAVLLDPDQVRARAAASPPEVQRWLASRFGAAPPREDAYAYLPHPAAQWAQARGLAVPPAWGVAPSVPREVAMALRPPGAVAPFDGTPPLLPTHPVHAPAVVSASAAAVTELLAATTALLDDVARTPVAVLRSGDGGVGVRELKRLGGALGASEARVRLALALCHEMGLLDDGGGYADAMTLSDLGVQWRSEDPLERALSLAAAWMGLGHVPTVGEAGGKKVPALQRVWREDDRSLPLVREGLLDLLGTVPDGEGTTAAGAAPLARWRSPRMGAGGDLAHHWQEAELIGLVALGAVSPFGRAVAAADRDAAAAALEGALPRTVDQVLFGADLTAVVPGDPSARVSGLLDSCADREGRGGAVVWRFSPGSVRRALDEGTTSAALLTDLGAVAGASLPQPLEYLVTDVARSHGKLRVRPAVSLVRCDDEPLLAQVVADRALRSLGLALVVPTVASSSAAPEVLLAGLRKAGYLPVPEGADGVVALAAPTAAAALTEERRRDRELRRQEFERVSQVAADLGITIVTRDGVAAGGAEAPAPPAPVDTAALAERLVASASGPVGGAAGAASATETRLTALARHLSPPQVRLLAHAVDHGLAVEIDYESATGGASTRVISDIGLLNESLRCWCHQADDGRSFRVERIRAVRPTPP